MFYDRKQETSIISSIFDAEGQTLPTAWSLANGRWFSCLPSAAFIGQWNSRIKFNKNLDKKFRLQRMRTDGPALVDDWPSPCVKEYYTETVMPKINTNVDFNLSTPKSVTFMPDGNTKMTVYECFRLPYKFYDGALTNLKITSAYFSDNYKMYNGMAMYIKSTELTLTPHLVPTYDGNLAHVSKTNTQNFKKTSELYKNTKNITLSYQCDPIDSIYPWKTIGGVVNNINISENRYNSKK